MGEDSLPGHSMHGNSANLDTLLRYPLAELPMHSEKDINKTRHSPSTLIAHRAVLINTRQPAHLTMP
jgi:hypothetical protein